MSKRKKYHILLIDDNIEYCEVIKNEASPLGLIISHFHNLEEGISALKSSKKYKAVILDGRCILDKDQAPGSGKKSFVFHAIQEITNLKFENDRYIPFCVNAENPDEFLEDLDGIGNVYKKKEEHLEMFEYLQSLIYTLPEIKIRTKHEDVFSFLSLYCSEVDEDLMEDLILNIEKNDDSTIISNLSIIRRLEEKVFDVCSIRYLKRELSSFENMRRSRTKAIISFLQQSNDLPLHLIYLSKNIYSTCSKYGNHNQKNIHEEKLPGKYVVKSFLNALFELIIVLKSKIELN